MEFVSDLEDNKLAPVVIVDGVARIERPSKNKIHVIYYENVKTRNGWVQREAGTLVWDRDEWLHLFELLFQAKMLIQAEPLAMLPPTTEKNSRKN